MFRRLLIALHTSALGLWFGALVMTGVAAAILFPTLKRLDPTLSTYPKYTGAHWLLAAGKVAELLFYIADIISFVCFVIAFGTLLVLIVQKAVAIKSILVGSRVVLLCIAVTHVAYKLMVLQPRMNHNLRTYWDAAAAGEQAVADAAQAAFSADHPTASNVLFGLTVVVGVLLFLAALGTSAPGAEAGSARYEEPRMRPSPT